MKRATRGLLLAANVLTLLIGVSVFALGSGFPAWVSVSFLAWVLVVGVGTALFLRPYAKWIWNKPTRMENAALVVLFVGAFGFWVAAALEASPMERFFGCIYLIWGYGGIAHLRHLPRVRAYSSGKVVN